MSPRDGYQKAAAAALSALSDIPRDEDGPVFAEPWQAQAFAMVCALHEAGIFSWQEWAETLGAVIKEMPPQSPYYECWLGALERIAVGKALVDEPSLQTRYDAWDKAARSTPHGHQIVLGV